MDLTATATVRRPVPEVYDFWRGLETLPSFMTHLREVRRTGERTSHWTSSGIVGRTAEWDVEITEELPGERFRWRTTGDAAVRGRGMVFVLPAPDGVCTEVHVRLRYDLLETDFGRALMKYFGDQPRQPLQDALRRMQQLLETGEVTRSDGAPWGKHSRTEFPQHPARPLSAGELAAGPPS
jgi:uncharacterized membrane protein